MIRFHDRDVTIFLVDDDELQLKILKTKFITDLNNYRIKTFLSGEDFLRSLEINPPHKRNVFILVLDYYLKTSQNKNAKDGLEILQLVKEKYPELEVIILSAYDDEDNIDQIVKDNGAIDFVRKNEHSYTLIQNILMRQISHKVLFWKKLERDVALYGFVALFAITSFLLLLFTFTE
jgi:FixJ family two-component response regulator